MATFNGTNGNDDFEGTAENDTATFAGIAAGYEFNFINGEYKVADIDASDGYTGIDTISNIEALQFADRSFSVAYAGQTRLTEGGYQAAPASALLADGSYIVVWQAGYHDGNIQAQRFDAAGNPVGSEMRINTSSDGHADPDVTGLAGGGFVVTWRSSAGPDTDIRVQRFDAAGNALGGETLIDPSISFTQSPSVTALAGGAYVVVWDAIGGGSGVYAQRFDAAGNVVGGETRIDSDSGGHSDVIALSGGAYMITWESYASETYSILAQHFDAAGNKVGGEIRFNNSRDYYSHEHDIEILPDGGYAMIWRTNHGTDLYVQHFDTAGNAVTAEKMITERSHWGKAVVTALDDGGYVIGWMDMKTVDIYVQRFDASGDEVGKQTRVSAISPGALDTEVGITAMADGGFLVTWGGSANDYLSGHNVYSQRFDANGKPAVVQEIVLSGSDSDDVMNGGAAKDIIEGLLGNDTLRGGGGNDSLWGDYGNDMLAGGNGNDSLGGGGDDDMLAGDAGNDWLYGSVGEDALYGGLGDDSLYGSYDDDTLDGGEGVDLLYGEEDSDTLYGRLGDDKLYGGLAEDVLLGNAGADKLFGGLGHDVLEGGYGADFLFGSRGYDRLTGGEGQDIFRFSAVNSYVGIQGIDTITDFSSAEDDVIQLDNLIFTKLTGGALNPANFVANAAGTAQDANDYVIYDNDAGLLYYDKDGSGAGASIQFAKLLGKPLLTAADFEVV